MKDKPPLAVLPLARPTFDVAYAEEMLAGMLAALDRTGRRIVGPRSLLFDAEATRAAISSVAAESPGQVLVLQVTFTDAAMTAEIARAFAGPLAIWAVPEPRLGGRLRLNALCGLNLAAHTLGLAGRGFGALYADPGAPGTAARLEALLSGEMDARPLPPLAPEPQTPEAAGAGRRAVDSIGGARIGRIGRHPDGFSTCAYDAARLAALAGVAVEEISLDSFFARAAAVGERTAVAERAAADEIADGLDQVDQGQLDRSLRLRAALSAMRDEGGFDAFAIRCWPETFTEYGGAVCGPVSMMGEARVPCACEADVYGALTTLLLQRIADAPAFLVDLVDLDTADDTGVVWHCGQAPASMADPGTRPRATIHSNRRMPLLFEFPLKPGRVTFFRISQARGRTAAVIGGGEMLARPMAFTGTSGVVRFDSPAGSVLTTIVDAGLEHHMALAYGDHRAALEGAAAALGIPVIRI
jgi:L-fucose isomerase-like protein